MVRPGHGGEDAKPGGVDLSVLQHVGRLVEDGRTVVIETEDAYRLFGPVPVDPIDERVSTECDPSHIGSLHSASRQGSERSRQVRQAPTRKGFLRSGRLHHGENPRCGRVGGTLRGFAGPGSPVNDVAPRPTTPNVAVSGTRPSCSWQPVARRPSACRGFVALVLSRSGAAGLVVRRPTGVSAAASLGHAVGDGLGGEMRRTRRHCAGCRLRMRRIFVVSNRVSLRAR